MRWNAKKFKQIINDRTHKKDASSVIQSVIDLKIEYEEKNKHYFKVILKQVTNEELLNIENIKEYISMVTPLPFKNHFIFKSKIKEELKKDNENVSNNNMEEITTETKVNEDTKKDIETELLQFDEIKNKINNAKKQPLLNKKFNDFAKQFKDKYNKKATKKYSYTSIERYK